MPDVGDTGTPFADMLFDTVRCMPLPSEIETVMTCKTRHTNSEHTPLHDATRT